MISKNISILLAWGAMTSSVSATQNILDACLKKIKINNSNEYRIEVKNEIVRILSPQFFGFNINWFGFQQSYWNDQENKIIDSITNSLNSDFNGAIYRYPGGSVANYFNWVSSIGPVENRHNQITFSWNNPSVTKFGYQEFLDFVKSVNGKPWIVTNLYGGYDKKEKEEDIKILANIAKEWVKYTLLQKQKVKRWELGNELDRGRYRWTPEKYSFRAKKIGEAITINDPNAKLVSMLRDFNVEGHGSGNKYNRQLAAKLAILDNEFALHQYYDGPPGGPSIPNRLTHICSSIAEIKKESDKEISIWITEHGRWPHAMKPINWKVERLQTYNLQSAISTADYIIAVSQLPDVKGAFIHALSKANGPWTLFHKVNDKIVPSIVYNSLLLFRKNMLSEVLETEIKSKNTSNYYGNYDVRASVQTNPERTKYNIWIINRAKEEATITLVMPQLASMKTSAVMRSMYDIDLNKSNIPNELLPVSSKLNLTFSLIGEVRVKITGQSISAIQIRK